MPEDKSFIGIFAVFVSRAPSLLWEVKQFDNGSIDIRRKKKTSLVNHYFFHIMDKDWGHITIRMCAHPPFSCNVKFNGQFERVCQRWIYSCLWFVMDKKQQASTGILNIPDKLYIPFRSKLYSPNRDGSIIDETFAINLAEGASVTIANQDHLNRDFPSENITDSDPESCWIADHSGGNNELFIEMSGRETFDRIMLQEPILPQSLT